MIRTIDIGDWDMNTNATKVVAHGVILGKIRSVTGVLRNDADSIYYPMVGHDGASLSLSIDAIDTTSINLIRANGSIFDAAAFSTTPFNRGWLLITLSLW